MSTATVYIRAVRHAEVDDRGLLVGSQHRDELTLHLPGGQIHTSRALTVATHTVRHAAPTIAPGWYPDAYVIGTHRDRTALVHQGWTPLVWDRAGAREQGYTGLNIHDWRGRSDGCITADAWWVEAAISAIRASGVGAVGLELVGADGV